MKTAQVKAAFSAALSSVRKEAGKKRGEVARASGISGSRIQSFENGTALPELDELYSLAEALDIHPAELVPALSAAPHEADAIEEGEEPEDDGGDADESADERGAA